MMSYKSPHRSLQPSCLCFCSNFLFEPMFVQDCKFILIELYSNSFCFYLESQCGPLCPFFVLGPDYSTSADITQPLLLLPTLVLLVVPLAKMLPKSYSWYPNQTNTKEIVSFNTKISVTKARGHYSVRSYTLCPQKVTSE